MLLPLAGSDVFYEIDGDGPPVVLLHGMGLDSRMWDDQVRDLADAATLIRLDLRGFGRSSRASDVPYSHAEDVWNLVNHLGHDAVHLVGLSMGGAIALETYFAAPDRVRSLTLLDSVIDGVPFDPEIASVFPDIAKALEASGLPAAREIWLDCAFFRPARREPTVAQRLAEMAADYSGLDWMRDDPHLPRPRLLDRLGDVSVPATVVVGDLDVPSFKEMGRAMAERLPNARHIVIPDAGHMVNIEAPAAVNEILREVFVG